MTDLSHRFAALMARMAQSDAELFRTISEQNSSVRQLVHELHTSDSSDTIEAGSGGGAGVPIAAALVAAGLLPGEDCALPSLKARFGQLAQARAWVEERIGKGPTRPTWAVIEQTCRTGAWPASKPKRPAKATTTLTAVELDARLLQLEQRLDQRLQRLEALLGRIVAALAPEAPG
ncbi:MAG: hypothetical protein ACK5N0_11100 [Synechococcaceae cyanobacterium]